MFDQEVGEGGFAATYGAAKGDDGLFSITKVIYFHGFSPGLSITTRRIVLVLPGYFEIPLYNGPFAAPEEELELFKVNYFTFHATAISKVG